MSKIRVALADDHTLVRKGFAEILKADDEFEVIADAPNGRELMQLLSGLKSPADVCLLDINMPEMDGYETLIALKARYPAMRFLILTQAQHEFVIVKMLKAGASGYMLKTVEPYELKIAIKTILEHPYYSSDLVNGKLISLVQKGDQYKKLMLSANEEIFLRLCCSNLAYKEIADKMGITERTAAFYRQTMFDKLKINTRTELALYALKLGLVPLEGMKDEENADD